MPKEMPRGVGLALWIGVVALHALLFLAVFFGDSPEPPVTIQETPRAIVVPRRDGSVVVILPDGSAVAGDYSESSLGGEHE